MAAIIKHGVSLLEKGGRHTFKLKGKALTASLPQMKDLDRPVLEVRINGRGKEGSAYGVKLYTGGNEDPDLTLFGRVDYRGKSPILQLRGDYMEGKDFAGGFITINTGAEANYSNTVNKNKDRIHWMSRSEALNAEIYANTDALKKITTLLNKLGLNFDLEEELTSAFTNMNEFNIKLAEELNKLNPFRLEPLKKTANVQNASNSINATVKEEIKINPYDYFKEDKPTPANTNKQVLNPLNKHQLIENKKQQIAQIDLNIKTLEDKLTTAEKEFKDAKVGGDAITKASKIKMIKEQLETTKQRKTIYERELANLKI
ncbi:hypothetical protein IKU74_00410 [bacterium]|nr:hypothetical protein [bacterium]